VTGSIFHGQKIAVANGDASLCIRHWYYIIIINEHCHICDDVCCGIILFEAYTGILWLRQE